MFFKIVFSSLKKNVFTNVLLLSFIFASTLLFSSALSLITDLSSSVNSLMEKAQTPHFMQMHSGEINLQKLDDFAKKENFIKEYQIASMLNIDGNKIYFGEKNLSSSVMDNGFCVQNELFDFLLDKDGNIINVEKNEIYVPLSYWKEFSLAEGDIISVCNNDFVVKGFLRDSQMNSDMASSKRFLINPVDYEKLKSFGSEEYLIEFRGFDSKDSGKIENAYIQSNLENNGPAISYSLFYMINALSDGILIFMIIIISILLVLISFLCIRFTLLATLEDDYREIGIMKAVGFLNKEISSLYQAKYLAIDFLGCLFGTLLSFPFKAFLIDEINLYVGDKDNIASSIVLSIFGAVLLFCFVLLYVRHVLKRIKTISPSKAVRYGKNLELQESTKSIRLTTSVLSNILTTNVFLAIQDVLKKKRTYLTLFFVLFLAVFIMIVPQNIYQTINDSSFINYMDLSDCNVRIDLQQLPDLSQKAELINTWIKNDKSVKSSNLFVTRSYKMKTANSVENLKIESGDYSHNTIIYIEGNEPKNTNDIALSYLCANEIGKKVGDKIELIINEQKDETAEFVVCGLYSDVTNGGKTAKMIYDDNSIPAMWYVSCIQYDSNIQQKEIEYDNNFNYGKFTQIESYIKQTVGSTITSIALVSKIAFVISLFISILITSLFLRLLISKDDFSIKTMRSLGFSQKDLLIQYISRIVFVLLIGIIIGTIAANTIGVFVAGLALSNIGIANFHFVINPLVVYFILPLSLILAVVVASYFTSKKNIK